MPNFDKLKMIAAAHLQAAANLHREQQALEGNTQNHGEHRGRALEVAGGAVSTSQFESGKRKLDAASEVETAYAPRPNKNPRLMTIANVPAPGELSNQTSVIQHTSAVAKNHLSIPAESMTPNACSSAAASSASHNPIVSPATADKTPVQESTEALEILFEGPANGGNVRLIDDVWKKLELDIKNTPGCKERKRRMEDRGGPYRLMINGSVCMPGQAKKNVPTIHLIFGRNADNIQTLIIEVTRLDGSVDQSEEHTFPVANEAALKKRILFQATVEAKKFVEDPEYFRKSRILRDGCTTTYSLCKKIAQSLPSPMTAKELGNRMGILDPIRNGWGGYTSMNIVPATPLVAFNAQKNVARIQSVSLRGDASHLSSLFPQPQ